MTNRNTKRALLASVLSLLLCVSMLVSSTFAWFTDTAKTNVNTIQAGELDIAFMMKDGEDWVSAEDKTLDFIKDENAPTGEAILWEPGVTYALPTVKLVNDGNLALKYKLLVNGLTGDLELATVLDVMVSVNGAPAYNAGTLAELMADPDGVAYGTLLATEETAEYTIALHMQETAGNKYQEMTLSGMSLTAYATQLTHEYDSYGNQYDKYADRTTVKVTNQEELNAAIAAATEPTALFISEGTYKVPGMSAKDIVFAGNKGVVIDMTTAVATGNSTLKFDGVNVVFDNDSYEGFQHTAKVVYENCALTGTQFLYAPVVEFNNCTFDEYNAATEYCVWTYGAENVTFTDCEFTTHGKAILIYNEVTNGNFVANVTLNNCMLTSDGTVDTEKAAIETGTNGGNTATSNRYNITVNDCTVVGFGINPKGINTGTTVYGNKNSMDADHLSVVINNVNVVASADDLVYIGTAEELFAFANDVNVNAKNYAGKIVILTNDIDLENKAWTPIGQTGATEFKGVFDGNGYSIKNLNVNNEDKSANCSSGLFGWIESHGNEGVTVKNLTIDGATVTGHHYVGVIVGYVYGTIENCHVKNATVSCTSVNNDANGDKCGAIAGYVGEDATIKDCTAADSTISAGRDAGQIVGAAKTACVTGCSAANVTVTANNTSTGANIRNEVIGRVL